MSLLFDLLDRRGWRDAGGTLARIAEHVERGGARSATALEPLIASEFLVRNNTSRRNAALAFEGISFTTVRTAVASPRTRALLLLSADPVDLTALRVQAEQRMIREELEKSAVRHAVDLQLRPGLLRTDLARYLLETRPSIVHFSGHGSLDGVYAEDNTGASTLISTQALQALFAVPAIHQSVEMVVLSSCLSEPQATAIAQSVPAVIGMSAAVSDDAALAFSRGLYMALGQELTIEDAFSLGCNAIQIEGIPEDKTPVLQASRPGAQRRPLRRNVTDD